MRLFALLIALIATPVVAHDYKTGGISVAHPFAYPSRGPTAAGYMAITNSGADDTLLEIRADVPRVTMHKSVIVDDVARMRPADQIVVGAGETVEFAPNGLHVMFMGLTERFVEGGKVPAVLVFENAGEVEVLFHVEARPEGSDEMDHSNH